MFDSCVRGRGDLAGVFEYDGETGYFYLYDTEGVEGHKVLGSVHVLSGEPDFTEEDVAIQWDAAEQRVGLFIRGALWAVFAEDRTRHGGGYGAGATPQLPEDASTWFGIV
jgi:hypothetical protein